MTTTSWYCAWKFQALDVAHATPHEEGSSTMLPLFEFAGDLVTEPVTFEEELKTNESLSLENMRALSRCAHTLDTPRRHHPSFSHPLLSAASFL